MQFRVAFRLSFLLALFSFNITNAQNFLESNILALAPAIDKSTVKPGEKIQFVLKISIQDNWHINANKPLEEFLIPTQLKFAENPMLLVSESTYPEPQKIKFSFSEEPVLVYEKNLTIKTEIKVSPTALPGETEIKGKLAFQGCNDATCLPPAEKDFSIKIKIESTAAGDDSSSSEKSETGSNTSPDFSLDEQKAGNIIEKGLPYALLFFFISGLALNLTPCVYPVIPITVSIFGSQNQERQSSTFLTALFYVLGIAIIFALLGLVSALAGKQWGFLFQNPWFVVVMSLIIFSMAASMFGAFEIRIPGKLMTSMVKSRQGVTGSFLMGLTVGFVIAPCAAGIIIGLVGLVAKLGIVVKGTLLFFVMGLGLGLPYLFLALFSGLLSKRPRPGEWMTWVRKLFGILLIGVGFYFILPQASRIPDQQSFYFGLLALFGGLLLGFLDQAQGYTKIFKYIKSAFGIFLMVLGYFWMNSALASTGTTPEPTNPEPIAWIHYTDQNFAELTNTGRPVALDFYADWCAPCKKMNRTTFTDPDIIKKSKKFQMIKIDCTQPTPQVEALMKKFNIVGMPTLVFLKPGGDERPELRAVQYLGPEEYLQRLNQAGD